MSSEIIKNVSGSILSYVAESREETNKLGDGQKMTTQVTVNNISTRCTCTTLFLDIPLVLPFPIDVTIIFRTGFTCSVLTSPLVAVLWCSVKACGFRPRVLNLLYLNCSVKRTRLLSVGEILSYFFFDIFDTWGSCIFNLFAELSRTVYDIR